MKDIEHLKEFLSEEMFIRLQDGDPNQPIDLDIAERLLEIANEKVLEREKDVEGIKSIFDDTKKLLEIKVSINSNVDTTEIDKMIEKVSVMIQEAEDNLKKIQQERDQLQMAFLMRQLISEISDSL